MSDHTSSQRAAQFLLAERHARNTFSPIPAPDTPQTLDEAYAVQEEFQTLLVKEGGPIAGYKIALTTPVMQQMVGFNEPVAGAVLAKTIHHSPASVRLTDYVHLGVECEIAVQLSGDLPAAGSPYSRERVEAEVGAVMAAFELVDDRNADYSQLAPQVLTLLADNAVECGHCPRSTHH